MKESKPLVKVGNEVEKLEGYAELLYDIKSLLEKAKYHAYKAVDNINPIVHALRAQLSRTHYRVHYALEGLSNKKRK